MPTPKPLAKVVILGGGPAGVHLAQLLHKAADITLVDRKDYYEINWATVRAHVQPSLTDQIFIPYADIPHLGSFIQADVAAVHATHVQLDTATTLQLDHTIKGDRGNANPQAAAGKLPYDYLAICTGGANSSSLHQAGSALSLRDRVAGIQAGNQALQNAGSVLIIGGGPVGVETAAEIAKAMPGKLVTIVEAGDAILPKGTPPAMTRHILKWLKKHGVKVLLNERVTKAADGSHATDKGTQLHADIVYTCTGAKANTGFLREHFGACLDDSGRVKVDSHLRLVGESPSNIFALGDCNNVPETKLGFLARAQAQVAASNIKALLRQPQGVKTVPKLEAYRPFNGHPKVLLVSLGRMHGVMHVGGVVIKHLLPRAKAKNLFIPQTRKSIGLDRPKQGISCARAPAVAQ